jgi:hypothetical protein
MAGRRSAECNAKVLILNHLSPKCESNLSGIVQDAYEGSNHQSSVVASFDFMEVVIPWMGFGSQENDDDDHHHHDDDNVHDEQEDKTVDQGNNERTDTIKTSSILSWAKNVL